MCSWVLVGFSWLLVRWFEVARLVVGGGGLFCCVCCLLAWVLFLMFACGVDSDAVVASIMFGAVWFGCLS